ncbi:hypothetical protein DPMN_030972 [Dreissena polymorpha]|uniref:Uncharacterized protein n=1 Tax=Dreissena polymorpha TaxID=45954 RepID=A0A9D4M0Z8_DREPO|nr:hypothetical protein DPMN_030972 [Dreissena polymorpha]
MGIMYANAASIAPDQPAQPLSTEIMQDFVISKAERGLLTRRSRALLATYGISPVFGQNLSLKIIKNSAVEGMCSQNRALN